MRTRSQAGYAPQRRSQAVMALVALPMQAGQYLATKRANYAKRAENLLIIKDSRILLSFLPAEAAFGKLSDSYRIKPAPRWQKRLADLIHAVADPLSDTAELRLARVLRRWACGPG
jgi:hypothetical protein